MAHTSERIPILTSDTGTDVKEEKKVSVPAKSSGDDGGRSDGSSSQEKPVSQLNTTLQPLSENLFKSLPTEIIVRILSYLTHTSWPRALAAVARWVSNIQSLGAFLTFYAVVLHRLGSIAMAQSRPLLPSQQTLQSENRIHTYRAPSSMS